MAEDRCFELLWQKIDVLKDVKTLKNKIKKFKIAYINFEIQSQMFENKHLKNIFENIEGYAPLVCAEFREGAATLQFAI